QRWRPPPDERPGGPGVAWSLPGQTPMVRPRARPPVALAGRQAQGYRWIDELPCPAGVSLDTTPKTFCSHDAGCEARNVKRQKCQERRAPGINVPFAQKASLNDS